MLVKQFEERVLEQRRVPAAHYDAQYFHSNWRAGVNNYSIEVRRPIEGRNPQLILDIFRPNRILDFGCGPGALLYFLWELGAHAEGLDHSDYARQAAPPEVRERIHVMGVEDSLEALGRFDLVVCREVLEHLTVVQIQKAVENLCKLSSRYIYVTTRFSKNRDNLLAVETEPEVDPTHISLLNKDFLRCLFVLQGFRSRPDLEERMDWKNYGRVVVVEKVA